MSTVADQRYWRTADGDLVADGDPAASTLAFGEGDEVPDDVKLPRAARKRAELVEDKAVKNSATKSKD